MGFFRVFFIVKDSPMEAGVDDVPEKAPIQ
jgi:hypothetical protein